MPVMNITSPYYYITEKYGFVRHRFVSESTKQTKALIFVFVFVFVLVDEQAKVFKKNPEDLHNIG